MSKFGLIPRNPAESNDSFFLAAEVSGLGGVCLGIERKGGWGWPGGQKKHATQGVKLI